MKKGVRIVKALILTIVIYNILLAPATALAEVPYKTYTHDGYHNLIETQAAYMPDKSITKIGDTSLSAPRDMKVTDDGEIYIADTGNRRILICDLEGNYIGEYGSDVLVYPSGVHVTKDKYTYVADRDAGKIFHFDPKGNLLLEYGKPNHPLYGEKMEFKPLKIVVNPAGNMFAISEGNTNGIAQISPTDQGTFLGYFGTNLTQVNITDIILRMFLTDSQLAKRGSNVPPIPDNMAIDDKGLIYTVTRGQRYDTLKRLNIAGKNVMEASEWDDYPAAVTAGNHDTVFLASSLGYIYEFTNEGDLLFVFGGKDDGRQRIGLSTKVEAIAVDLNDYLYVLDSDRNQIHKFKPTEFTIKLHQSISLYSRGRYIESMEPLEQILEMNGMFGYANKAMGLSYLQVEDYDMAMKYAKLAVDKGTYSDAFWEVRNIWIRENMIYALGFIIILLILIKALQFFDQKRNIFKGVRQARETIGKNVLVSRLKYSLYFMRHPIDGCYGVRWEGKSSYLAANILLVIFTIIFIVNKYFTSFLTKTVREGRYELLSDVLYIAVVFILLIVSNYLVCTINDGEGSFKQIYTSFVYCLTPYLVMQPFIFLLSWVVTENEVFLVQFSTFFMVCWIITLILITIKELNNITVKETAKVVFLTFFAALIIALIIFILYVLSQQVIDFIAAIFGEVVYRLGF